MDDLMVSIASRRNSRSTILCGTVAQWTRKVVIMAAFRMLYISERCIKISVAIVPNSNVIQLPLCFRCLAFSGRRPSSQHETASADGSFCCTMETNKSRIQRFLEATNVYFQMTGKNNVLLSKRCTQASEIDTFRCPIRVDRFRMTILTTEDGEHNWFTTISVQRLTLGILIIITVQSAW